MLEKPQKSSRELEILVAKIQKQLSPDAEVIHDVRLLGRHSEKSRQIDILVKQKIGQYELKIIIDCKDYSKPVDVKGVEEFYGLLEDVGAHKGALVCPKGFTAAAKTRAQKLMIDLYSPVDTDPHKWQVEVKAPTLCDWRGAKISFCISCNAPVPLLIPYDFYNSLNAFCTDSKENLGKPFDVAFQKWNKAFYPTAPGNYEDLLVFEKKVVLIDNGYGTLVPVEVTASVTVEQELYFGYLPISKLSGFKDELSGTIITNAFEVGILDPIEIEENWQKIKSEADMPSNILLKLSGLIAYEDS